MKPEFKEQARQLFANEADEFLASLDTPAEVSVRYNPLKLNDKEQMMEGDTVVWSTNSVYLNQRPSFTLDPHFHAGLYYVQEASSMFLEALVAPYLAQTSGHLRALDLCAAPGGKSTHLAAMLAGRGLVVANEVIAARSSILRENAQRWGTGNICVTSSDPKQFAQAQEMFDILLIDAPCSGEGMFRKDLGARDEWSPEGVELCTARSKRIIADAIESLRDGGLFVYSTCTFNKSENEEMLEWISQNYTVSNFDIDMPDSTITITHSAAIKGYRFLPHKCRGEGMFMAAMIKGDTVSDRVEPRLPKAKKGAAAPISKKEIETLRSYVKNGEDIDFLVSPDGDIYGVPSTDYNFISWLRANFNLRYSGVQMGKLFGGELRPAHPLALYHGLEQKFAVSELSLEDALNYLRSAQIDVELFKDGINLLCYKSTPIGFVKRVGRRYNTLLPSSARIMNL